MAENQNLGQMTNPPLPPPESESQKDSALSNNLGESSLTNNNNNAGVADGETGPTEATGNTTGNDDGSTEATAVTQDSESKSNEEKIDEKPTPPKPPPSGTIISCANCNAKIQELKIQKGRDIELDNLLNETLMTPLTMEVCDDDKESDKITATVEITMFEALIEIFALRTKSPHLVPLLERVMQKNSIENANALGIGTLNSKAPQNLKLLSLCEDCTERIANLYELYKEFTLLSMKSNAFFSRIVGSSASGAFAKSNIKSVPVPKSHQNQTPQNNQKRKYDDEDGPIIPDVYVEDGDDSMDYSANQTYSDDDNSMSYTMEVETVYGEGGGPAKIKNSRGRAVLDHSSRGSGMYSGDGAPRRGEKKRKCERCGKIYYYSTSYEKHMQTCRGPVDGEIDKPSSKYKSTYSSDDEIAILPDIENHHNSGITIKSFASTTPQQIKLYQCRYCPKTCQSQANLVRHERTHGGDSASPSTTCKACERTFGSVYDLRRHYQTNTHKQRIREGATGPIDYEPDEVMIGGW